MTFRTRGVYALLGLVLLLPVAGCGKDSSTEPASITATEKEPQAYITTGSAKVKSGPGGTYETIAELPRGTKVNVVGREKGWLKIVSKRGRRPGYIDEGSARPLRAKPKRPPAVKGTYTVIADTYVRRGPGLHYEVVAKIKKGTQVQVVAIERDWLKVESKHGRSPGYLQKMYAQRR